MAVGGETKQILTSATLDVALQRLARSHQVVSDARNALLAILALDVAGLLGLIAVVATLAAGSLQHAPDAWWVPGISLVLSFGWALTGFLGGLPSQEVDHGEVLARALATGDDQKALNSFDADLIAATLRNLDASNDLEQRALVAIGFFLLALLLAFVPIGVDLGRVFPL